ncbi:MAG: alpha/beta fold hydrolase [Gemmatimonadetes bacterium]|nr:alpha/beta fold hydrolase [Gemmatimonadota bacterium]
MDGLDATGARATSTSDPWIGLRREARTPRLRLLAFPYAGGGASIYRRWLDDLGHSRWLEFIAVQLPGRETRLAEPPHTAADGLADRLATELLPMPDVPYALFGYSMGAVIAYELAIRLVGRGSAPTALVVAARTPPHYGEAPNGERTLDRETVVSRLQKLHGTPAELMRSPLFDEHFLPTLRADFLLADSHRRPIPQVLPCPVVVAGGLDDPEVPVGRLRGWEAVAGSEFRVALFEGGHFFLHRAHREFISWLHALLGELRP